MKFPLIFPIYLVWHYTTALRDLNRLLKNTTWFLYHFFSVEILLKTLFLPFRRLSGRDSTQKQSIFERIVINVLMRIVGFGVRAITIIAGVTSVVLTNLFFIIFFVVWIFLPILVPILFLFGIGFFI